jgi:virulence-associated protein VagC
MKRARTGKSKSVTSIRKHGDGLFITPVKPNWASFFALQAEVTDDFLENRHDSPPQSRDPL